MHAYHTSAKVEVENPKNFRKWQQQTDFDLGFVPLGEQLMPDNLDYVCSAKFSSFEMHEVVNKSDTPNFMQARTLNFEVWQKALE